MNWRDGFTSDSLLQWGRKHKWKRVLQIGLEGQLYGHVSSVSLLHWRIKIKWFLKNDKDYLWVLELWYITLECNFTCTLVMNHLKKLNVLLTKRVHTSFNEIKKNTTTTSGSAENVTETREQFWITKWGYAHYSFSKDCLDCLFRRYSPQKVTERVNWLFIPPLN